MPEDSLPWWGNLFFICLILAWLVRTIILPFAVARRVNRPYRFAVILPEERNTLTARERQLLILMNALGFLGLILFFATGAYVFNFALRH